MRQCEIYLHGIRCGLLTEEDNRTFTFTYDKAYLIGDNAEPVSLTLRLFKASYAAQPQKREAGRAEAPVSLS